MAKPNFQARLPQDQAEEVERFIEERDIAKSEGVRRLIVNGLEQNSLKRSFIEDLRKLGEHLLMAAAVSFVFAAFISSVPMFAGLVISMSFVTAAACSYLVSAHLEDKRQ